MTAALRRVLSEGFRVFFLCAGLFGVFAGVAWGLYLGVHTMGGLITELPYSMAPHYWHGHEMIFGFASAAIGGFLLTAVPNWTGGTLAKPLFIGTVAALWLAGRLAMWYSASLPGALVAAADLSFVPVIMAQVAWQLTKRPKPQNVMFLLFLTLFWTGNLLTHLDWLGVSGYTLEQGLYGGLLAVCAMISVLGGRVTPAFTRNAMRREDAPEAAWPVSRPWLERAAVPLALLLPVPVLAGAFAWAAPLALALGAVQIVRLTGWRPGWALRQPILIALHSGLAMLGLGLILWGAAVFGYGSEVAALHVLGIGAVGGMTLAVMSRAALGHSGRDLVAPGPVALAYALIPLATLLRWLGSALSGGWYFPTVLASAALWSLAFALFTAALWPALTGPRRKD
ncbi:NnrS family protein [Psychromarinibacter sp. C21-152]|uniref:NnrS family protein n=1 Tax=Psychromarinibacter sediminicola TaxID=3033385 RepID=A0AAE3TAT2_9RHOB|nr:NnrS family protein [Psychromarinibacter sediminicola]MDF0603547.1 NnrS family protein [Psychromarinibacter sediminicola]